MLPSVPQSRVAQNRLSAVTIPAPTAGIDSRMPLGNMPLENCIYSYNILPSEYGMVVRQGYREWVLGTEDVTSLGVSTLIAFDGTLTAASDDRLFAVTNEGIWDVTTYDSPPILKYTFLDQSADAGYGVATQYVDAAGEQYLLYADSKNGLFEYVESTDTWQPVTGITGPVIENIVFVVLHKQRLWMIEENSSKAWYLPIGSKTGQATEFFFGGKFTHGGLLVGLYNWSVDGGSGVDDILVSVSSSGDVIPYKGDDPSSADTWSSVGVYFIGKIPKGRKTVSEYAGNLYILSSYGIIAMSDVLRGVDAKDIAAQSLSFKISRPLREVIQRTGNEYGWELEFMPSIGSLVITTPQETGYEQLQFVMNLTTEGWGIWRGVPINSIEEWNNFVYFGTVDNRVCVMDVYRDNITITPPADVANGIPIKFSMLTSYQRYNADSIFKQVQFIRPDFHASNEPTYQAKALYDYDFAEQVLQIQPPVPLLDTWDLGIWDIAIWGAGTGVGFHDLLGAGGIGRAIAVALQGEATDFFRLISFDVMYTTGGPI